MAEKLWGAAGHIYKSYYGTLSVSSPDPEPIPLDWEDPNWILITPTIITFRRWVLFNDSSNTIRVRVNSLDNDDILVYAGEYFGDNIHGKAIYLKNDSLVSTSAYRLILGNVVPQN